MADYWKSQAKKFCDFCKCWIADNRPSIEFHEKGKRHKENVAQRLKDIGKKSAKEHKEMLNVDREMKKMEEAALKAYMKDVEANADYSSQVIKQKLAEKEKASAALKEEQDDEEEKKEEEEPKKKEKMWYEAVSDEGHTYYWHIETGESAWEPPEEGFMSVDEQKKVEEKEAKKKAKEEEKVARLAEEKEKERKEEERARLEREKMRSRRVKDEKPSQAPEPASVVGPAPRFDPYGSWTTVESKDQEPVDLQLPEQEYIEISVPSLSEPAVKFKEKTIASLDVGGSDSGFKKRKLGSNSKRNLRQRLDED